MKTSMPRKTKRAVRLDEVRVIVVADGDGFFAQGLEIDYFACGESIEEAVDRFTLGLALTMQANLNKFGSIDKLRSKQAAPEVFAEFESCASRFVVSVEMKELANHQTMPFRMAQYGALANHVKRLNFKTVPALLAA